MFLGKRRAEPLLRASYFCSVIVFLEDKKGISRQPRAFKFLSLPRQSSRIILSNFCRICRTPDRLPDCLDCSRQREEDASDVQCRCEHVSFTDFQASVNFLFVPGVSLSDEAAVKTRLLFDGDGTGEERRLNLLLKSVSSVHLFPVPILVDQAFSMFHPGFFR